MSMITEQVNELRKEAEHIRENIEFQFPVSMAQASMLKDAADTIEQLSAKLQALNKKTMFSYFDGIADSMKEDNKELEAYQKAFEDIRAEIRQKQWHIGVDNANQVIEIIDKHDPSKAGKEKE